MDDIINGSRIFNVLTVQRTSMMNRNERSRSCWSQPPHSINVTNHANYSRGLGSTNLDEMDDIVNAFSARERVHKYNNWRINRSTSNYGDFTSSNCCLKKGLVHCQCLWPQTDFSDPKQQNDTVPKHFNCGTLPYMKKTSSWSDNVSKAGSQGGKTPEEFILDDNELCLLNYYDIPINVSKRHHVRNTGKVKTVSIIDTLSELASGATDKEDEGGFSSAVSESAVLGKYLHKPKARNVPPPTSKVAKQNYGTTSSYVPVLNPTTTSYSKRISAVRKPLIPSIRYRNDSFNTLLAQNLDDSNFSCNSLKRTLKYLRKAVVSNVVDEECHRNVRDKFQDDDASRLCFSDSDVKDTGRQFTPRKHNGVENDHHLKTKSLVTVVGPYIKQHPKPVSLFQSKSRISPPEWIQEVFAAANTGDIEKMKLKLKDIDPALVRNLSDDHGNNLWHICAVQDNFECLNWLCTHNQHHIDALKDGNKYGFTPVALAVKHGSLLAVQWLVHNTTSKSQLLPQSDSRSLLHIAARYGQYAIVEWLLNYMSSQDLDAGIIDSEGNTALHLASKYGHISCAKSLIFQAGGLKTKNECGLKPLDLAVKHCRNECADFLTAMESSYNLASLNLRQYIDIQHLQKENAEMKNYFKELLALTKRIQHRQKEFEQLFKSIGNIQKVNGESNRAKDNCSYLDDYSQLLTSVMTNEKHRLLMLESSWKKTKRHTKQPDITKKPLDVLRSQFSHVLNKANCQSPPIPSASETSEDGVNSEEEDPVFFSKTFSGFSAPDVVNSLLSHDSMSYLDTKKKLQMDCDIQTSVSKKIEVGNEHNSISYSVLKKENSIDSKSGSNQDVNLRMFFKQNPNLRQSSETCSVLEVLEPSSSDSEESSTLKAKLAKTETSGKEAELSSLSLVLETVSPCSGRPSSSDPKISVIHSSNNGSKQNQFPSSSENAQNDVNLSTFEKKKSSQDSRNNFHDSNKKYSNDRSKISQISVEPDLIKGTHTKKIKSLFQTMELERKATIDNPADIVMDTPNISTDSESLEADRSFSSLLEAHETISSSLINPEKLNTSTTIKKKGFLFKFALRGKWQSKPFPHTSKKEISAEEFRETYSRSVSVDSIPPTSQPAIISENPPRKIYPLSKTESENCFLPRTFDKETSFTSERQNETMDFPIFSLNDQLTHSLPSWKGLLPPRRDPPPAPPLSIKDDDQSQDHSDDDVSLNILKSSISSYAEGCITPLESPHNSYLNSRASDMWHSSDSKSHFRPVSSASRVDSPSREVEGYPLNKSCSTEILSALDLSTGGRQSPAPSEVSKTESALSPPSDVSKTESTRYLSQLCKIEEIGHLAAIKGANLQRNDEHNIKESLEKVVAIDIKPKRKSVKKNSNKPWYEFSDDEDIIVPQRYQTVSVNMRSSSEDEGAVTG